MAKRSTSWPRQKLRPSVQGSASRRMPPATPKPCRISALRREMQMARLPKLTWSRGSITTQRTPCRARPAAIASPIGPAPRIATRQASRAPGGTGAAG